MDCQQCQNLLDAHLDRELDLRTDAEVTAHVEHCQDCASRLSNKQTLANQLGSEHMYHTAPEGFEQRIRTQLAQEAKVTTIKPRRKRRRWDMWTTAVASAACASLITLGVLRMAPMSVSSFPSDALANEMVASHIRSLMVDHLTDVSSSDRHTVKPWFNSKLDFSPRVRDFTSNGFPLVGGRLDYIDGRTVSALVYRHRQHIINLYTWATGNTSDRKPALKTNHGYHLVNWQTNGMHYCLVSDLNARELKEFARLIRM